MMIATVNSTFLECFAVGFPFLHNFIQVTNFALPCYELSTTPITNPVNITIFIYCCVVKVIVDSKQISH